MPDRKREAERKSISCKCQEVGAHNGAETCEVLTADVSRRSAGIEKIKRYTLLQVEIFGLAAIAKPSLPIGFRSVFLLLLKIGIDLKEDQLLALKRRPRSCGSRGGEAAGKVGFGQVDESPDKGDSY